MSGHEGNDPNNPYRITKGATGLVMQQEQGGLPLGRALATGVEVCVTNVSALVVNDVVRFIFEQRVPISLDKSIVNAGFVIQVAAQSISTFLGNDLNPHDAWISIFADILGQTDKEKFELPSIDHLPEVDLSDLNPARISMDQADLFSFAATPGHASLTFHRYLPYHKNIYQFLISNTEISPEDAENLLGQMIRPIITVSMSPALVIVLTKRLAKAVEKARETTTLETV